MAARQGHADAQATLDILDIPQDAAESEKPDIKTAALQDAKTRIAPDEIREDGKEFPPGVVKPARLGRKAIEQGHADAQVEIGGIHVYASDVSRDDAETVNSYFQGGQAGRCRCPDHTGYDVQRRQWCSTE